MNTTLSPSSVVTEDQFGHRLAARLSAGNLELSHEVGERLRVARAQAVARRKVVRQLGMTPVAVSGGRAATLGAGWWTRIGSVIPLVALAAGLVAISVMQDDSRTNELAEIDSALLTDDLPPAAYTDPGFAQFLKATDATSESSEH
ncbi:DUF3619 family protein [Variovorax sp. PBL-E5]|uniref:DUF3619 family protein n=1 Tax=Variovorax sp. PBL-E5 TaxID=434014 RepID=UPI001315FEF8|nr:DUF3619 family protein [Variovorax sp. PBL-E5]VTU29634.1 hypothetical protein E5CHR_02851 [Variovorax sp. PBL-E5]